MEFGLWAEFSTLGTLVAAHCPFVLTDVYVSAGLVSGMATGSDAAVHQVTGEKADEPLTFWKSFYFSIVTFTTLGFGDVVADNTSARIFVTLEVIFGYIMLGGLISIFANKLASRS